MADQWNGLLPMSIVESYSISFSSGSSSYRALSSPVLPQSTDITDQNRFAFVLPVRCLESSNVSAIDRPGKGWSRRNALASAAETRCQQNLPTMNEDYTPWKPVMKCWSEPIFAGNGFPFLPERLTCQG